MNDFESEHNEPEKGILDNFWENKVGELCLWHFRVIKRGKVKMAFDFIAFEKCRQNGRKITKFHFFRISIANFGESAGFFPLEMFCIDQIRNEKCQHFNSFPLYMDCPHIFFFETEISKCCAQIQFINFYRIYQFILQSIIEWL